MKKGILLIAVLSAWFLLKNGTYMQVIKTPGTNLQTKMQVVTKAVKKDLFQFTTVHLSLAKRKTNNSKYTARACTLKLTNEKQLTNHEPLLIINGL
ncbi:MAG: hypothetical protein GXC73_05145 [Chitinophagaceae bacterium]|nr:hypothetical protein [Chitinophagaceae bacterium]